MRELKLKREGRMYKISKRPSQEKQRLRVCEIEKIEKKGVTQTKTKLRRELLKKKTPRLVPHLCSLLGWLIMMSYSVHWWELAAHLYPFRKASPLETGMSPVSILNVVVFPAPLIPSKPKHL